ncbi:MAG: zinc-ribbon domain-containing protein [Clostridia bacterium]|nr:zinc-ribbon domain-containing protein [Clostridia bacterium]MCL6521603.1 zinc-ribbon domain-containing protein [Bacillota bacterium]
MDEQQLLEEILRRCDEGGGKFSVPVQELAETLGVERSKLYYLLNKWREKGQLETRNRGRLGMEIGRPGSGVARPAGRARARAAARPAARGRRGRQAAEVAASAAEGRLFCPWCGAPVAEEWRYCYHCGNRLPEKAEIPGA